MAEKYLVITDKLELELKKMRSEGRTKLPSEQELAARFSCSRQTIRASLDVLCQKGLIEKRKGSGSYLAGISSYNKTVFFVCEDCDRYQSPALIAGLKERLSHAGFTLKSFSTGGSIKGEKAVLLRVLSERPAALIIEPVRDLIPNPNLNLIEEIKGAGIPVIYSNSVLGDVCVLPDNAGGAKSLTNHLLESGRRNIACVFRMDDSSGRDRFQGYINALSDSGADFDESRCLLLTYQEEKDIILCRDKKLAAFAAGTLAGCDAVICQNGMIAHQLLNLLIKAGRSVPDDIVVACFDNGCYSSAGLQSAGYDNAAFCKALAGAAVALAEGRSAKSVMVEMR